jgi:hypothetical protein
LCATAHFAVVAMISDESPPTQPGLLVLSIMSYLTNILVHHAFRCTRTCCNRLMLLSSFSFNIMLCDATAHFAVVAMISDSSNHRPPTQRSWAAFAPCVVFCHFLWWKLALDSSNTLESCTKAVFHSRMFNQTNTLLTTCIRQAALFIVVRTVQMMNWFPMIRRARVVICQTRSSCSGTRSKACKKMNV